MRFPAIFAAAAAALALACGEPGEVCEAPPGEAPDFLTRIGCRADFDHLASDPPSASIPGARSAKTVVDRLDGDQLYFQNSNKYPVHWDFARAHLSVDNGKPFVPDRSQFNQTEYSSPNRRFLLGALTYYDGPAVWTYEVAPYDRALPEMLEQAYEQIAAASYFGDELFLHPTSDAIAATAADLPDTVKIITTEELFADIDYQPLNLGTSMGRLIFVRAADLDSAYLSFRDIAVLDAIPNDISVVSGIITEAFQTPLSHINVLSQNRGTPNMALRGAFEASELRALEDKWVRIDVGAFEYQIAEVTKEEADQWWEDHRPDEVGVPNMDTSVTGLHDIETLLDLEGNATLGDALDDAIPAFGGKASHYAAIYDIGESVPMPKAFAIPLFYYRQFMEQNGFDERIDALLADADFQSDPAVRDQKLRELRDAMKVAPVDSDFEALLLDKLASDYPGIRMRFRSSTNAEDLDGFTGAGLYTSRSGDPGDPLYPVLNALRTVWASVWYFRAFEERAYRSIDHKAVGMALLVHHSFPDEEANGVALTANIFDRMCVEPGFYVNVQVGEASVVKPDPGVTTDQFIYHYEYEGQPIVFLTHSSLIGAGKTVLTRAQTHDLGMALDAIHKHFLGTYGPPAGSAPCEKFYAMDVEFKFDGEPGEEPVLAVKQARPHPGWGL